MRCVRPRGRRKPAAGDQWQLVPERAGPSIPADARARHLHQRRRHGAHAALRERARGFQAALHPERALEERAQSKTLAVWCVSQSLHGRSQRARQGTRRLQHHADLPWRATARAQGRQPRDADRSRYARNAGRVGLQRQAPQPDDDRAHAAGSRNWRALFLWLRGGWSRLARCRVLCRGQERGADSRGVVSGAVLRADARFRAHQGTRDLPGAFRTLRTSHASGRADRTGSSSPTRTASSASCRVQARCGTCAGFAVRRARHFTT